MGGGATEVDFVLPLGTGGFRSLQTWKLRRCPERCAGTVEMEGVKDERDGEARVISPHSCLGCVRQGSASLEYKLLGSSQLQ